jgi:hypothetical protein
MKSHRNASGDSGNGSSPPTDLQSLQNEGPSDFSSLTAAPTREQRAKATEAPSDFHSLTGGKSLLRGTKYQHRTATDGLIDFSTPFLILIMVWSAVYFLLDVRYVYTEVHSGNLRFVATMFVLGVVALNRVIAREGSEESFMYIGALFGVVALYTVATTSMYDVGSFAGSFVSDVRFALLFNLTIVSFMWWMVNRLMHECCIDENTSAGDVGILTGTARKMLKASKAKPKKTVMPEMTFDAIDPLDFKEPEKKKAEAPLEATQRLQKRHPGISIFYFSVPVMIVFALGLRVIQHGGITMIYAGHFYVGCYTVAALSLLMLTSLGGLREYFRARRVQMPTGIGTFWLGLGSVMVVIVAFGAAALPMPGLPELAYIEEHETDYWSRDSTFQVQSVVTPMVEQLEQAQFMQRVGTGVLIVLGLFLAYSSIRGVGITAAAIARNRLVFPQWVVRFFDRLDKILQRFARLPKFPERRRRIRVDRSIAKSAPFVNPMSRLSHGHHGDPREIISTSYDALCALAYDMGVPRDEAQTPYEFLESFPVELSALKEEAEELTQLYVMSAYSPVEMDSRVEDRLRKFWVTYEKVRGRVVR